MSLTSEQVAQLRAAMAAYNFPATYYDFAQQAECVVQGMPEVERYIHALLTSPVAQDVENGLANIVFWGNANAGYQMHRVMKFKQGVTAQQVQAFQALVRQAQVPGLDAIKKLGMPQFSGISFISKITAFLNPAQCGVLDLLIARMRRDGGPKALNTLRFHSAITPTAVNCAAYAGWCAECQAISQQYLGGQPRVVDVERGFFYLIQNGQLEVARAIYEAA